MEKNNNNNLSLQIKEAEVEEKYTSVRKFPA